MKFLAEKKITILLFFTAIILVSVVVLFYYNSKNVKSSSDLVEHTQEVLRKSDKVLLDVINIETGLRGYILSDNEIFLGPYYNALETIKPNLEDLSLLCAGYTKQNLRVDSLKIAVGIRLAFTKQVNEALMTEKYNELQKIETIEQGEVLTNKIRKLIEVIYTDELKLLKEARIENAKSIDYSQLILLLLLIFIIVIFGLVFIILQNQRQRNKDLEEHTISQQLLSNYALSLLEASLDPLVTINTDGKITDMNEATANITGLTRTELRGTDFFTYFTESQRAREVYQEVFAKGSVADKSLTLRHKDGKLTDVSFNGSVYKDAAGNVLGVVIVARDIAEQKLAMELRNVNKELAFQNEEKEKRAEELSIANKELLFQNDEKEKRAAELIIANKELIFQNDEKEKRAAELVVANKELAFQNEVKEKRAAELVIANKELAFQNDEKEKRAAELIIANEKAASVEKELKNARKIASVGSWYLDINTNEVSWSEELYKMYGFDPLLPPPPFPEQENLFTAESWDILSASIANTLATGIPYELELETVKKDGSNGWLWVRGETVPDKENKTHGLWGAAQDITVRKQSEIELLFQNQEKEKRAAELIIANTELAFQNDEKEKRAAELVIANTELAFQNDEKEKRAAELIIANKELSFQNDEKEKRAAELVIANTELALQNEVKEKRAAELIIANKELAFQNEEKEKRAAELVIANKELHFQNREKEKRAAELIIANEELIFQSEEKGKRAAELIIADKELLYQIREKEKQSVVNIELEAIGDSLRLSSQYSLSLIEASRDPLFTVDPEGRITDMNEATVKVTGVSRDKIIGTYFFKYFSEPDEARKAYMEVFSKGFIVDFPLTIKDGVIVDVLCNGSVYKSDAGNVLGVVIVARDITDQKRIATELTEAIVFAELAVGIAEEAKTKAESATLIAETAVKAKQQFLSNMSHEIRTPMNAIIGFTKVLLKTDTSSKQKEYLQAIKLSGDALIVLINDILDLAKVDAGKMVFEHTPFKMAMSISAMLHLFEPKIREKNIGLIKEFDSNIPDVLVGDPVRLHQIILNLVSNAVKFTNKGKITVSVRLLSEDDTKVTIAFDVKDTGIGITENKMGKIFDNFQQASSDTSRLYGGTGLGLAIVRQLVEAQDGSISVESKLNEGSTFGIILDFLKTKADADLDDTMIELDSEINDIRVLVVEDIALNQLLMRTLLDDFGFKCEIAANGKIAIDKLKTNKYDVILMDLQMPEMNGFEATDYIRNTMHSEIPIIALTADVTTVDLEKCRFVGMNDYIAKPIDEKLLYTKIVSEFKRARLINGNTINNEKKDEPAEVKVLKYTDLQYLITRTKANPVLMMEMISLYLEQTPPLISLMKKSWKEKDWSSLYASVHKMIPSFAIMGISTDYENMAKKVQDYAKNQQESNGIGGLVQQIDTVCTQACVELEAEYTMFKNAN